MLIVVVSDIYRMNKFINLVKEVIKDVDILIYLGDNIEDVEIFERNFNGKVYVVVGNCDYLLKYFKEGIIEVCGKKIFYIYGDLYGVKSLINNIYYKGRELGVDVVLFGYIY